MSEKINPISVEKIFNSDCTYRIPIYQRNFAWEEKQILELIEDINHNDSPYFLGNLIVNENEENNTFEIIDGQQRLTTLFIICKVLEINIKMKLDFECRESSKILLNNLRNENNAEKWNQKIINAYEIANEIFNITKKVHDSGIRENFKEKLKNAQLLIISVPEGTDLNHYFEVMNTRGEQLEKVDILKSKLMEKLKDKKQEFAEIWNVCSNMNEYVIKSLFLNRKNQNNLYEKYFKFEDNGFIWRNDCNALEKDTPNSDNAREIPLLTLLEAEDKPKKPDENNQSDGHYESLVQFPEFLLHILNIMFKDNQEHNLDKEKILERFECKIIEKFAEEFIINLLKYRFYYDMYIGKRKSKPEEDSSDDNNDENGIFDIRKPMKGSKNIYAVKLFDNDNLRAIQWALRITYTAPKSMHWITSALKFVNDNHNKEDLEIKYLNHLEKWMKKKVKEALGGIEDLSADLEIFNLGVGTPHIIFAYLDYLLKKGNPAGSDDYYYNFRTSVEHLYSQNDSTIEDYRLDKTELKHNFGNLFLMSREVNSALSNYKPEAKLVELELGKKRTPKHNEAKKILDSSGKWADNEIIKHSDDMIKVLREAMM